MREKNTSKELHRQTKLRETSRTVRIRHTLAACKEQEDGKTLAPVRGRNGSLNGKRKEESNSRGVFPPLETLAVKAMVAEGGEDAVDRLVHPLQAHGALRQLGQLHHWQAGSLGGG